MDDNFLVEQRKAPNPEFAQRLYQRINQPMKSETTVETVRQPQPRFWMNWKAGLAGALAVLALALFISPSARALAQDFLNLFRVKRFVAVNVDTARLSNLQQGKIDFESLLSANTEVLQSPGKPQTVDSPAAAGQLAGIRVLTPAPTSLPVGYNLQDILVQGAGRVRFTADTARLQALIETLGVSDVKIPSQLNGQQISMDKPPMVVMNYASGSSRNRITLLQSHNPQIALPAGVSMSDLGEIALRVTGLSADEAHRMAQSIDWNSTLLVPVPANASSFREVEVRGVTGLLITSGGSLPTTVAKSGEATLPQGSVLLWAQGDMIYAITGSSPTTLVDMANSLQ
jgi:hypothetical protein